MVKGKDRLAEISSGGNVQQGYVCVSTFHPDSVGFSLGCPGYLGICLLPVTAVSVWRAGAVVYMRQTECVQQNLALCPEDYCPEIPAGKEWITYLWPEF